MKTVKVKFLEKNQVWQDETTEYWFEVNGIKYNMNDCNGEVRLFDAENCPMDELGGDVRPEHDEIYALLYPEYQKHIMD